MVLHQIKKKKKLKKKEREREGFLKQLGYIVIRSLNDSFEKSELSATPKEGFIVCIPEGDKRKEYIKNWRPISLLNVTK